MRARGGLVSPEGRRLPRSPTHAQVPKLKRVETFTHEGWFGICPIYANNLDTDCPGITPRGENGFYEFLFFTSHYAFMAFFTVADVLAPAWQPGFPIVVTGELLVPHRYEWDDNE